MVPKLFGSDATHGFCNSKGEIVVSPRFNNVKSNEHFNAFEVGGYWGFLDENGKCICEAKYTDVKLDGEYAFVNVKSDGKLVGVIDKNMKEILAPEFERVRSFAEDFYLADGIGENYNKYKLYSKDFSKCYIKEYCTDFCINAPYIAILKNDNVTIMNMKTESVIGSFRGNRIWDAKINIKGFKGDYPIFIIHDKEERFIIMIKNEKAEIILDNINDEYICTNFTTEWYSIQEIYGTTLFLFDKIYCLKDGYSYYAIDNLIPEIKNCKLRFKQDDYILVTENEKKWYLISGLEENDIICAKTNKMIKILKEKNLDNLWGILNRKYRKSIIEKLF